MKPRFLNLFMEKLTLGRVLPIISANISCDLRFPKAYTTLHTYINVSHHSDPPGQRFIVEFSFTDASQTLSPSLHTIPSDCRRQALERLGRKEQRIQEGARASTPLLVRLAALVGV